MSIYAGQYGKHLGGHCDPEKVGGSIEGLKKLLSNPDISVSILTLEDLKPYGIDPEQVPNSVKKRISDRGNKLQKEIDKIKAI